MKKKRPGMEAGAPSANFDVATAYGQAPQSVRAALHACTSPYPNVRSRPGEPRSSAEAFIALRTEDALAFPGHAPQTSAATPLTCGVAIDVPSHAS